MANISARNLSAIFYTSDHQCGVTQPLLLEQLREFGVDISAGTLNNILIEDKQDFHNEKDRILNVGLEVSAYINVDDTGARWGKRKLGPVPGWEGTK